MQCISARVCSRRRVAVQTLEADAVGRVVATPVIRESQGERGTRVLVLRTARVPTYLALVKSSSQNGDSTCE
jgi:hypothetical protein